MEISDEEDNEEALRFFNGRPMISTPRIAAASTNDAEAQSGGRVLSDEEDAPQEPEPPSSGNGDGDDENEDLFESEPEPLTLPESTHTLLFTHPLCSLPFGFAFAIAIISFVSLYLAFENNLGFGELSSLSSSVNPFKAPVNIERSVRVAQYLAIFICLIMEEEIPTGLYLLRKIPSSSFKEKFPNRSYNKFVFSAILRMVLGYLFLLNVFVVLVQATEVIEIFYDVLALQFISELDDIAFALAQREVLGMTLQRACTARLFQTEFEKQKFQRNKKASIFLKAVYFLNFFLSMGGLIYISFEQKNSAFQCDKITVDFGDAVWEDAVVRTSPGQFEKYTLVFSTFNGAYEKLAHGKHGRPVYQELRKFDNGPYDQEITVPATIEYSQEEGFWIFKHPHIGKHKKELGSWLLRSPQTTEYNLLNVGSQWDIWFGVIGDTTVNYSCMSCNSETDCNLNGDCVRGECRCRDEDEVKFLGPHCEVELKNSCRTIRSEVGNHVWSIKNRSSTPGGPSDTLFQEYNRPVYSYVKGIPGIKEGEINWLVYTGQRWIYVGFNPQDMNFTKMEVEMGTANYHAFWSKAFGENTNPLNIISDPTTGDNPVGVDWFAVTEYGNQFGPFGALYPMQLNQTVGRGLFRCAGEYIPATGGDITL